MKPFLTLIILLSVLLAAGCASKAARGHGSSGARAGKNREAKVAPEQAAARSQWAERLAQQTNSVGTNLSGVGPGNSAGAAAVPGGTTAGGGTGTSHHGFIFWFYVALGIAFVVWLVLAIVHRVHRRRAAHASAGKRGTREPE